METSDSGKYVRVFFALWPDQHERAELAAWQPPLRELCGGKAMRFDNIHATLVFLGGIAPHRLEALKLAAQEVRGKRFDLTFDQARYWGHNHIAYAAPSHVPSALEQLVMDLEQNLRRHRFRFDSHPKYKPHVTLLRHAKWRDEPLPQMKRSHWRVASFVLVQSVSGTEGVSYESIAHFSLD